MHDVAVRTRRQTAMDDDFVPVKVQPLAPRERIAETRFANAKVAAFTACAPSWPIAPQRFDGLSNAAASSLFAIEAAGYATPTV